MIDLLASRYPSLEYVMEQDYETGIQLMTKAMQQRDEDKHWILYCNLFPTFTKNTFMTFDEFYKKQNTKVSMKPKDQIRKETNKIKQLFAKKR
jgi:hypothetical protein